MFSTVASSVQLWCLHRGTVLHYEIGAQVPSEVYSSVFVSVCVQRRLATRHHSCDVSAHITIDTEQL